MIAAILALEDGCEVLKAVIKGSKRLKQQQHDN